MNKLGAEFFRNLWLVLGGCGSAVLAAAFPGSGSACWGVSLAFGLTVLTMAYAIGRIFGLPLEPGGLGRALRGRALTLSGLLPYIAAQVGRAAWRRAACCWSSPAARPASTSRRASPHRLRAQLLRRVDPEPEQRADEQERRHRNERRVVALEAVDDVAVGDGRDSAPTCADVFISPTIDPACFRPMSRHTPKTPDCWNVIAAVDERRAARSSATAAR